MITGLRIPKDFFETGGKGESDLSIHSGSYHLALHDAGIGMCNVLNYSSILPGIATITDRPKSLVHGAVLESIMAVSHAGKGVKATAGILYRWLYNKNDGSRFGGLVCEHSGNYDLRTLDKLLNLSMEELYRNGFSANYNLGEPHLLRESFVPSKKYGTSLVSLCFISYQYPELNI